jgi:hypothetical protein
MSTFRLALTLLFVLGCTACASAKSKTPTAGGGVVPWLDRPLRLYLTPDAKLVRYPTSAPRCRAAQLRVSQGRKAVGLGHDLEELVFTNVGAKPCLLRGYPIISARTPSGGRRLLRLRRGGTYFGQLLAADIRVGGHGFLDLETTSVCDNGLRKPVRFSDLRFTLPNGGTVGAPKVSITSVCGLWMSELGLPRRYTQPRAAPGTAGTLRAHVRLPASIRAGTTLRYTVALSNPTAKTVTLRPCPGYTEALVTTLFIRHSFALNCAAVRAIAAHGSVRYAMRLAVPGRTEPGPAKIGWSLNTPTGPFAADVVQVVPD